MTMPGPYDLDRLYGPVLPDMPRVDAAILELRDVEFDWLARLIKQVLGHTGKRMRPAMTLLSGRLAAYDLDLLVPMAASAELLHTASLVHDDTLDEAAVRRGSPTVNHVWNKHVAVLFGDYVFAAAAEMVSRTANVRVMRLFAQTLRKVCDGELAQNFAAFDWAVSRDSYYRRIAGKTASLFSMATESGAVLSGQQEPAVQALKRYGHNLGMAFQIADDILDFISDEDELGKPVGNDLGQGTITLPAILMVEADSHGNPVRAFVESARRPTDLDRALAEVRRSGALEQARAVAQGFAREARAALEGFAPQPARACLELLTEYALNRTS